MSENPIDPHAERLIALLYGELGEQEEAELRRRIAQDPALRAQWEELTATRSLLGRWEVADSSPGFVFLKDERREALGRHEAGGADRWGSDPAEMGAGLRRRWRESLRRLGLGTAWGLAATAALLLILSLGHFRVERVSGGWAFLMGRDRGDLADRPGLVDRPVLADRSEPRGADLRLTGAGSPPAELSTEVGSGNAGTYLTHDEFLAYAAGMTQTMVALLNEYGRQRDQSMVSLLRTAWGDLEERQAQSYGDLKGRIETVGLGLAREKYNTGVQFDLLMQQRGQDEEGPATEIAPSQPKGEK